MRSVRWACLAAAAIVTLSSMPSQASADSFLFGISGGAQELAVFTTGGEVDLVTSTSPIFGPANQGWWSDTYGVTDNNNTNYLAGHVDVLGNFHDFFTFDVTSLHGKTITGASLNLVRSWESDNTGAVSLQYSIGSVSTDARTLNNKVNNPSPTIYNDLGKSDYGSFTVALGGGFSDVLNFALNGTGIADLQAAADKANSDHRYFSIGGHVDPNYAVPEIDMGTASSALTLSFLGVGLLRARRRAA